MKARPTTNYHIFAVYNRDTAVSFIPDSGATHILIRDSDAHILHSTTNFAPHTRRPQFEVANRQFIAGWRSTQSPAPSEVMEGGRLRKSAIRVRRRNQSGWCQAAPKMIRGGVDDLSPSEGTQEGQC
jgi:hypothetical protein